MRGRSEPAKGGGLPTSSELADSLRRGIQPIQYQPQFRTNPGERYFGFAPVQVSQWLAGSGEYVQKRGFTLNPALAVAMATTHAVGNARRKSRAAAEAAATWRPIDSGTFHVTDQRFSVQGQQWVDLWYRDVRTNDFDGGIVLEVAGMGALRLDVLRADYWYMLYRYFADGVVAELDA